MAVESALQVLLMTYLAQGILSATQVHSLAQASKKDLDLAAAGHAFPKLEKLAGIKHARNLNASIYTELAKDTNLPRPQNFDIPMKGTSSMVASSSILLPHELFHHFFQSAKGWTASILPDQRMLPQFWNIFRGHPCMQGHPLLERNDFMEKCIPLSLHGDETPITGVGKIWRRKALILSWSSLLAIAGGHSTEDCSIYCHGLFEKFILPDTPASMGTMQTLWLILKWSFQSIWEGKWPSKNPFGVRYPPSSPEGKRAGMPLANGFFGCLVQLCGDLEYYASYLSIPRWSQHSRPCSQCRCTYQGPMTWLDCRQNTQWQFSHLTPLDWRSHFDPPCFLFQLPGMSALSISMDYMHCMFLGWLQYLYGSIISILVFDCIGGTDYLQNLLWVGDYIKSFQKANNVKHRYNRKLDKLSMFQKDNKYPKLRGKAIEISALAQRLWVLWQDKMDSSNVQHRMIQILLQRNSQISDILEEFHPRFGFLAVPMPQCEELYSKGTQMAHIHSCLMTFYQSENEKLFNLTTKTHFVMHSLYNARWVHPSLVWCFKGEDTMQRVAKLWKSCLDGCKHWQVAKRASWKERHLLAMRSKVG